MSNSSLSLPDNSKIIDTSLLNNIVSRLDSLEKKDNSGYSVPTSLKKNPVFPLEYDYSRGNRQNT